MKYRKPLDILEYVEIVAWLLLLVVPFFIEIGNWLVLPSIFISLQCFRRFSEDRKDLKNARNYFRLIRMSWHNLLHLVLVAFSFDLNSKESIIPEIKSPQFFLYLIPIIIIYSLFNFRLSNFTSGFRWYISGIKLPGRRRLLIPWSNVSEVKRVEGKIFLTVLGKEKSYKIHKSDRRAAEAFVRHYERITAPQDASEINQ